MKNILLATLLLLPLLLATPATTAVAPDADPSRFCPPPLVDQAWVCISRDKTWYCYELWLGTTVTRDCFHFIGP